LRMAKTDQKYLVDRETVDHLVAMLKDGVREGASEEELKEQAWEILDSEYRARTDQSLKEMKEGKSKRFKNADEMIKDLEAR
jgi:glucose dehydrogenase